MSERAILARGLALLLLAVALSGNACAQAATPSGLTAPEPQARAWDALDPAARTALQPWAEHWDQLPEALRLRLQHNAARWQSLTPAQRDALRTRLADWDRATPQRRAHLRARYEALQGMSADERADVRRAFERFQALPAARKATLRKRFAALSPEQRNSFLLDAGSRDTIDTARRYFTFVPPEERAATLAMLRDLDPQARQSLRRLAQRSDARQREDLRRALIDAAPETRAALIGERLR